MPEYLSRQIDIFRFSRFLRRATVVYLGLPLLIFFAGWLVTPLAILFVVVLIFAGIALGRDPTEHEAASDRDAVTMPVWAVVTGLIPPAVASIISGAGGLGLRTFDWVKHDAVLMDLVRQSWPVEYATEAGVIGLVYYIGYYLPAAVVGKLWGWGAANLSLALFSLAGVILAVLWLMVLARGFPLRCGLIFVFFSGMDVLGSRIMGLIRPEIAMNISDYHLDWWAEFWKYSGNVSLLNFAPHQALAGWLLTALVVAALQDQRPKLPALVIISFSLLWSPFVSIGLLPFLAVYLFTGDGSWKKRLKDQLSWANAAGGVLIILLVTYYSARFLPLSLPESCRAAGASADLGGFWLIPARIPLDLFIIHYSLFVICEFLLLWVLLVRIQRTGDSKNGGRAMLFAVGVTLLGLPLFHYGLYNDLVMRVSIPALFVLQIFVTRAFREWRTHRAAILLLSTVLAVGALYSANLLRIHGSWIFHGKQLVSRVSESSVKDLFQVQLKSPSFQRTEWVRQYLGSADSFFFRYIARPAEPRRIDQLEK